MLSQQISCAMFMQPYQLKTMFYYILFYSLLFYSILFYSILFYSILLYYIIFYYFIFYYILFDSTLLYSDPSFHVITASQLTLGENIPRGKDYFRPKDSLPHYQASVRSP